MRCDLCECQQGIPRLNGQFYICDDCNHDSCLVSNCTACGKEESCGEMVLIAGEYYCDHECYAMLYGEYPALDECEYLASDADAWKTIQINRKERESALEAAE